MKLNIRVEHTKRTIQVDLNPSYTSHEIVSIIKLHENMSEDHLCFLVYKGLKISELENIYCSKTAPVAFEIQDGDILEMRDEVFKLPIETATGDFVYVEVKSSETIEMIKSRIQEKTGVSSSSFDLCRNVLAYEKSSISKFNVEQNAILHMALNLAPPKQLMLTIFVQYIDGGSPYQGIE